jgi:hypothetical protein
MALANDDDVIETFPSDRTDQSLHTCSAKAIAPKPVGCET